MYNNNNEYLQEAAAILAPQNPIQGRCDKIIDTIAHAFEAFKILHKITTVGVGRRRCKSIPVPSIGNAKIKIFRTNPSWRHAHVKIGVRWRWSRS